MVHASIGRSLIDFYSRDHDFLFYFDSSTDGRGALADLIEQFNRGLANRTIKLREPTGFGEYTSKGVRYFAYILSNGRFRCVSCEENDEPKDLDVANMQLYDEWGSNNSNVYSEIKYFLKWGH